MWFGKGGDPAGRFGTTAVTAPRNCSPTCKPFWGHGGKKAQELGDPLLQTDKDVGGEPNSVLPVGGAGAVVTSSLPGMRYLRDLSEAGFAPIALSAPYNRRSLVALGAERRRSSQLANGCPCDIDPYRDRGTGARRPPAQHGDNAFRTRPAGSRAGSLCRISRETGAADPRRSAATPRPRLETRSAVHERESRKGSSWTMTSRFATPPHLWRTGCRTCGPVLHSLLGGSHGGRLPCHRDCRRQQLVLGGRGPRRG